MGFIPTSKQTFKIQANTVRSSASGSWSPIGGASRPADVNLVGVYWNPSGAIQHNLQIRDSDGDIWFNVTSSGPSTGINYLTQPLTLKTPFEYLCSEALNTIIIHGRYA